MAVAVLTSVVLHSAARAAEVDFNRDIRPILAANCLKCHGIDDGARKSKLRLDVRETATGAAKSGKRAIVPGQPDRSELVRRVFAQDADDVMPPASAHLVLGDHQKQVLRDWIAQGAKYQPHWAFVAPQQVALPEVGQKTWPKNPIDYFILARLESTGLRPSPEADRYTLVRRLYLDLIGLPPMPAEADSFVNDPSPDAYEHLVDKLLASPRYGERWARRWLDLARYADTNGFEKDRPRSIWPYRDWVINALNADMPFDQFTVEQLAGDMLPNATPQQKIATGFHRNTMLNEEGGIDPLEYRFHAMIDRVNTTGTVWLGMSVRCAQCHTHKYDPITQKEYYRLMALLNNADEPEMEVPDPRIASRRARAEAKIARLESELANRFPVEADDPLDERPVEVRRREALDEAFAAWKKRQSAAAVKWTVLRPAQMHSTMPILTLQPDNSVLAGGDITKRDVYDLTFHTDLQGITAVRLEALPDTSLPAHGPGMVYYEGPAGDFFLSEITLATDGRPRKFSGAVQSFAAEGFPASKAIDGDPQTGWRIDGGQGRPHVAVFTLDKPAPAAHELSVQLLFERYHAAPLGRFRISVTTDRRAAQSRALPSDIEEALTTPAPNPSTAQDERLFKYFLSVAPELANARKEIDRLRHTLPKLATTLVMKERPTGQSRPTYLHHRGEFLQRQEQVDPGVPAFLPPLPSNAPANRLTFARWLVSRDNPLTARITVNRQWQAFFGRGIVRTLEDFGYPGDPPTHPQLLDWLAVWFMDRGWSLKQLDRLIVTSATYRQASNVSPELLARDPQNLLLARGPRFRIEAEMVRDSALRASGLLSEKLGGPSVFPPQPESVTTEGAYGALKWRVSMGQDRFRRSLYTFAKRTTPFALYNTFDAPTGEECIARREVSNSPLQALSLMNDTVFVEAAQALGKSVAATDESDDARTALVFRRLLTRRPEPDEMKMLVDFACRQRRYFAGDAKDAVAVCGSSGPDSAERATWTVVARAVMNLDEAVTKQ